MRVLGFIAYVTVATALQYALVIGFINRINGY